MVENAVTERTGAIKTHTDTAVPEAEFFFCPLMNDQFSGSLLMPPACFSSPVLIERRDERWVPAKMELQERAIKQRVL